MLNNLQSYILDNIQHLKNHNNNNIIVITDKKFNTFFENKDITIINVEDLFPSYTNSITQLQDTFRQGFWQLTSYRFNVI